MKKTDDRIAAVLGIIGQISNAAIRKKSLRQQSREKTLTCWKPIPEEFLKVFGIQFMDVKYFAVIKMQTNGSV